MGLFDRFFGKSAPAAQAAQAAPEPGTVRIICATTFLHGAERFEAGDVRTLPTEQALYFVANGWARVEQMTTGLDVQDGVIASGDNNG